MTESKDVYLSYIANCVFNAFLCYAAVALNSVTIYAVRKTSSLPQNVKTLLLSVAVSDLGVGLLVQPLYTALLGMLLEPNVGNYSAYKATSSAQLALIDLLCYDSFFGVTALSVDRFLAIYFYLRYNELVTHKRVVVAVILVWVVSAITVFDQVLGPSREGQLRFGCFCNYSGFLSRNYRSSLLEDLFSRTTPRNS